MPAKNRMWWFIPLLSSVFRHILGETEIEPPLSVPIWPSEHAGEQNTEKNTNSLNADLTVFLQSFCIIANWSFVLDLFSSTKDVDLLNLTKGHTCWKSHFLNNYCSILRHPNSPTEIKNNEVGKTKFLTKLEQKLVWIYSMQNTWEAEVAKLRFRLFSCLCRLQFLVFLQHNKRNHPLNFKEYTGTCNFFFHGDAKAAVHKLFQPRPFLEEVNFSTPN